METTMTVTEAARNFSDLINRIAYRGDTAVLTRNGTVVARIVPEAPAPEGRNLERIAALFSGAPRFSAEETDEFERHVQEFRRQMNAPKSIPDPWEKWG